MFKNNNSNKFKLWGEAQANYARPI